MTKYDDAPSGPATRMLLKVAGSVARAGAMCLLAGLCLLGSLVATRAAQASEPSVLGRYPGRLVDIGTHALHLDCRGTGRPLIVLESGIGGFSLEWHAVREALAGRARVCTYDRAGYGWSQPAPMPRTARRSAAELAMLLAAAGERPPYLLAGHSYGGLIVREFAARWPEKVAGIALLDAAAPEQFTRLPPGALPRAYLAALAGGGRVFSMPRPAAGFAPSMRTLGLQLMMLPKARHAYRAEMRDFERSARALAGAGGRMLDAPLVVISRARAEFDEHAGGARAEQVWHEMQARMRRLSARADHWIAAGAGHQVHADRPDLVAHALRELGAAAHLTVYAADAVSTQPGYTRLVLAAPAWPQR